jgi:hypothetical protein
VRLSRHVSKIGGNNSHDINSFYSLKNMILILVLKLNHCIPIDVYLINDLHSTRLSIAIRPIAVFFILCPQERCIVVLVNRDYFLRKWQVNEIWRATFNGV